MAVNKQVLRVINPKADGYEPDKVLDEEHEDQIAVRGVTAEDGRRFIVRSKDPYGLWRITPRKGPVPAMLSGMYTSQGDAERAIIQYCAQVPKQ